jgi:inhibitor of KinA sporulation pathway (predicted exonuclease)
MTTRRNRQKQTVSFDQRLHQAADAARDAAGLLPEGQERETLLEKARQAEIAARINEWLASPGHRGADEVAGQRDRE